MTNQTLSLDNLLKEFRDTVFARGEEIDPGNAYDWDALAFGWAIGKGADTDMATQVSIHWYPK